MVEFKIAIRYIFSKHTFNFISIINFISLCGIMIGVAALIIVLSIFNAFQNIAVKQIVGYDPHIKIEKIEKKDEFDSFIKDKILTNNKIESHSYISETRIICFKNGISRTARLNSVLENQNKYFSNFEPNILIGNMNLQNDDILPKIIIGAGLADALRVMTGDTIFLTNAAEIERSILINTLPSTQKVLVSGIFQTNVKDYDINFVIGSELISESLLQENLIKSKYYAIRLKNIDDIDFFISYIQNEFEKRKISAKISNWKDLNREYYNVMKFEKMSTTFILGLIILVAIFNVFASLTMTIIEKKKDISILRAIGGNIRFIQRIYLYEGIFVGFVGSVLGGILGLILCYGQISYKWFRIDTNKYIMDSIPILIDYSDVLLVVIFSFLLSVLATIYPAWKSGNISLIESIREE